MIKPSEKAKYIEVGPYFINLDQVQYVYFLGHGDIGPDKHGICRVTFTDHQLEFKNEEARDLYVRFLHVTEEEQEYVDDFGCIRKIPQ